MNKKILAVLLAGMVGTLAAQQDPGMGIPEENPAAVAGIEQISKTENTEDLMHSYLQKKGWNEGENTLSNGDVIYVATGIGVIQAPRSHRNYLDSRTAAFSKAFLQAKGKLVQFRAGKVQSAMVSNYAEGSAVSSAKQPSQEDVIQKKVLTLIEAKLDNALRAEGIEPEKATTQQKEACAKKVFAQEEFAKLILAQAQADICGLQAYRTFEGTGPNEKGEIGVVAVWSKKSQAFAYALGAGSAMPAGKSKKTLAEQLPKTDAEKLNTFGVKQVLNEKGEYILLSFGQAGAVTTSRRAQLAARSKSEVYARAQFGEFVGEKTAIVQPLLNAESTKEFEDASEAYENESGFAEKIASVSKKVDISGASVFTSWTVRHPITNQNVCITVMTWHPAAAARAANMTNPVAPASVNQLTEAQLQQGQNFGAGMDGDEDAL
ncbi:MAG: hypothetical protein J6C40_13250 [Lentisphaeria bacterium]|nr:hypothetical protein [Lentisphaeria bacterium]